MQSKGPGQIFPPPLDPEEVLRAGPGGADDPHAAVLHDPDVGRELAAPRSQGCDRRHGPRGHLVPGGRGGEGGVGLAEDALGVGRELLRADQVGEPDEHQEGQGDPAGDDDGQVDRLGTGELPEREARRHDQRHAEHRQPPPGEPLPSRSGRFGDAVGVGVSGPGGEAGEDEDGQDLGDPVVVAPVGRQVGGQVGDEGHRDPRHDQVVALRLGTGPDGQAQTEGEQDDGHQGVPGGEGPGGRGHVLVSHERRQHDAPLEQRSAGHHDQGVEPDTVVGPVARTEAAELGRAVDQQPVAREVEDVGRGREGVGLRDELPVGEAHDAADHEAARRHRQAGPDAAFGALALALEVPTAPVDEVHRDPAHRFRDHPAGHRTREDGHHAERAPDHEEVRPPSARHPLLVGVWRPPLSFGGVRIRPGITPCGRFVTLRARFVLFAYSSGRPD